MKTLPKNIMSAPALDMCENFDSTFKDYGDVFAIDSDMGSVCLSYTDTGIDITDLAGLTLSEAIAKLPSFGIRALYWKDTDHRMQYGIAGEIWTKDYLSDLPTAWSVVDEMCDTPVWDCVVTGFYYDTNTGWFCIIIDEPVIGCLTRSLPYAPEDFTEETTLYDIRVSKEQATDGTYCFPYLTTLIDGETWVCNNDGTPDTIIGNVSDREDDYYAFDVTSLEEAQRIMEEIPCFIPDEDFTEELCENTHAF